MFSKVSKVKLCKKETIEESCLPAIFIRPSNINTAINSPKPPPALFLNDTNEKAASALPSVCPGTESRSLHRVLETVTCFTTAAKISCHTFASSGQGLFYSPFLYAVPARNTLFEKQNNFPVKTFNNTCRFGECSIPYALIWKNFG